MPKTSTPMTKIPGKPGPAPGNPKALQGGTPGIRGQVAGPWTPLSWNSREPEKAVRPIVEEGSTPDKDKKPPPQIAYSMEGVSNPARPRSEDDGEENIAEAKPLRPLTSKPLDAWPLKAR